MNSSSPTSIIILILVLLSTNAFSQTSSNRPKLNISAGYLYSKLGGPRSYDPYVYYDYKTEAGNGYSISALVDFPRNNFEVSLGSSFFSTRNILTYKRRPLVDQGLWGYREEVKLNYLNFRILLKYYPLRWMNFQSGLGFSFPINHQIRTLEIEEIEPDIPIFTNLTLNVWEDFESSDAMAINFPVGVTFGLERGPFVAFNYYFALVNMTKEEESSFVTWGGHKINMFELSVGWKFDFEKKE